MRVWKRFTFVLSVISIIGWLKELEILKTPFHPLCSVWSCQYHLWLKDPGGLDLDQWIKIGWNLIKTKYFRLWVTYSPPQQTLPHMKWCLISFIKTIVRKTMGPLKNWRNWKFSHLEQTMRAQKMDIKDFHLHSEIMTRTTFCLQSVPQKIRLCFGGPQHLHFWVIFKCKGVLQSSCHLA